MHAYCFIQQPRNLVHYMSIWTNTIQARYGNELKVRVLCMRHSMQATLSSILMLTLGKLLPA